jgi:hypothetical protein
MSREITNEVEERRVIRLLGGAADAIPPLDSAEVSALLRGPVAETRASEARRRPFARAPHLLSVGAVAAATALAVLLPLQTHDAEHPNASTGRVQADLIAFPEGSALSLLLSRQGERRA